MGPHSEIEYAAQATALDPDFAEYMLYYCRLLIDRGLEKDFHEATELLRALSGRSARILEILDLARQLPVTLQGDWHDDLCAKATRFWLSTEMREMLLNLGCSPSSRNRHGWTSSTTASSVHAASRRRNCDHASLG